MTQLFFFFFFFQEGKKERRSGVRTGTEEEEEDGEKNGEKKRRNSHQVPRDVPDCRDDDIGECLIGLHVASPQVGVEPARTGGRKRHQVVQQGPELLLAEAAVVALSELRAEEDGAASESREELESDRFLFERRNVVGREASDVEDVDVVADALLVFVSEDFGKGRGEKGKERGSRSRGGSKKEREKKTQIKISPPPARSARPRPTRTAIRPKRQRSAPS